MKFKKTSIFLAVLVLVVNVISFGHSGRTDSNGGHKDNQNASGLGNYHYHCDGNPPHLHDNGVCPYQASVSAMVQQPLKMGTYKTHFKGEALDLTGTVKDNTTLIELRALSNLLNLSCQYVSETGQVICKGKDQVIVFTLNDATVLLNDVPIEIATEVVVIDQKALLPMRFLAECLGYSVSYDAVTKIVEIQ